MVFVHKTHTRKLIIGPICIVFNVLMYAAPLTVMVRVIHFLNIIYNIHFSGQFLFLVSFSVYIVIIVSQFCSLLLLISFSFFNFDPSKKEQRQVIRTKSVKYMPFLLSFANFCNGAVWTTYALLQWDPFIVVIIIIISL